MYRNGNQILLMKTLNSPQVFFACWIIAEYFFLRILYMIRVLIYSFTRDVSSASLNQSTLLSSQSSESSCSSKILKRWENTDVRFLITTPVDNKHQAARPQRGTSLKIIAQHFSMTCGRLVTGEQCMKKWGKLTSSQKEIGDHNNKTGNEKKCSKLDEQLSECPLA